MWFNFSPLLLIVAFALRVTAQADPSIQAPGLQLELNKTVTVSLFGTLPPFQINLLDFSGTIVEVISNFLPPDSYQNMFLVSSF